MSRVKFQRLVYIDSEINTIGNGQTTKVIFPAQPFSVGAKETMRMILSSFEFRRNWYSINQTNNTFYLNDGAGNYTEITIAPGSYRSFPDLATAIQTAVAAVVAGSTCAWDDITRKFTITLGAAAPVGSFFVCFQCKTGVIPVGVSNSGFFNDIHEILGAQPTRDSSVPVNAFGSSTGPGAHISPYVGALNTLEAIYIRTGLQTNNYQTFGFERDLPDQNGLTPTQIFARIPLSRAYYDNQFEFVSFEDPNDLFQIDVGQKQLTTVNFRITDDKGRDIAEVSPGQAQDGCLSFKMVLKWQVLEPIPSPIGLPNGQVPRINYSDPRYKHDPDPNLAFQVPN